MASQEVTLPDGGQAIILRSAEYTQALTDYVWQHVAWKFEITPSRGGKEGKITAKWPGHDPYTRIFNTADIKKMTMFEWIQFNQQQMIKDIMIRLEAQYGSNLPTTRKTDSSPPRLSD